ncbi:MAG: FecR family protein, partial [bacterium]|nr:FecR family protein [bacterium]
MRHNANHKTFLNAPLVIFTTAVIGLLIVSFANAQTKPDCRKAYDKESYQCLLKSNACLDECLDKSKNSEGHLYVGSNEVYNECKKASGCSAKSDTCSEKTLESYYACLDAISTKPPEQPAEPQEKQENPILPLEDIIIDGITYAPALVDVTPTRDDPMPLTKWPATSYDDQGRLQARVIRLDGTADMQLSDGTWVVVEEGTIIPYGATIFTGYAAEAELQFSEYGVVTLRSLAELNIEQFEKDSSVYRTELKLETGELRFKVIESKLKTDMKVSTPNYTASPAGTDFGASHNKETGITIWEIYDGSIEIESLITGEKKVISSTYGSPIKRIEATNNGVMVEKIAIP